jgi:hypothetical protein
MLKKVFTIEITEEQVLEVLAKTGSEIKFENNVVDPAWFGRVAYKFIEYMNDEKLGCITYAIRDADAPYTSPAFNARRADMFCKWMARRILSQYSSRAGEITGQNVDVHVSGEKDGVVSLEIIQTDGTSEVTSSISHVRADDLYNDNMPFETLLSKTMFL